VIEGRQAALRDRACRWWAARTWRHLAELARGGEIERTFAIITTRSNAEMVPLHNRMPVVVDPKDWPAWLGESGGREKPPRCASRRPTARYAPGR
jgi:putative SOS response-associated peptidase YedK